MQSQVDARPDDQQAALRVSEAVQTYEPGVSDLTIANRTLANAQTLAATLGANALQLSDVAKVLAQFDMVIASTGSTLPVLGKGTVEQAIRERKRRPMFMVDIAVPRDIEPGVGELPDVYLYTIDDLTQLVEVNKARRLQAASGAENLVEQGTQQYQRERRVQRGQGLLQAFRNQAEQVRDSEMARTLKALENGADPAAAREALLAEEATGKHSTRLARQDAHRLAAVTRHATGQTLHQPPWLGPRAGLAAVPSAGGIAEFVCEG